MNNIFNSVPGTAPKRNLFDLSHQVKTTFNMGELIPFFCEPVIPGDQFKISSEQLIRFAPLIAPIMSRINVYIHFFFVPNRLIWKNWEDFITQSHNGKSIPQDQLPEYPRYIFTKNHEYIQHGSLADYLGFQTFKKGQTFNDSMDYALDALPFNAYQKIFFDYYRDENLSDFQDYILDKGSGDINHMNTPNFEEHDADNPFRLRRRAWKKDYFTSALPFAQKGDDVLIPGQPTGDIYRNPQTSSSTFVTQGYQWPFEAVGDGQITSGAITGAQRSSLPNQNRDISVYTSNGTPLKVRDGAVTVDIDKLAQNLKVQTLGNPDESTIRDLRRAYAAQRYLERKALGGSRYIEQNLAFFGVKSSDARLQRAEFLGGMKQPVVISQLLQTSQTTETSPQGTPSGNGVSAGRGYLFNRFFEEYGIVMGIVSVMPVV